MATKIIESSNNWKPVTIEIEFTSPEQLAVFVELFGTHQVIPILKRSDFLKDKVTDETVQDLINKIAPYDVWSKLSDILTKHHKRV